MGTMLYDVSMDAIEKLTEASPDELTLITDAIANVLRLAKLASHDGLLALEEPAQCMDSEYVRLLVTLIVNGTDPMPVYEIGINEYWSQAPQGIWAMVYYIYLRGITLVQVGEHPETLKAILWTLIPAKWRQPHSKIYEELFGNASKEQEEREIFRKFSDIHPVFEGTELLERISVLETKVKKMNDISIQRVLREVNSHVLPKCLYGLCREVREKIIDNLAYRLNYMIMEDVVYLEEAGNKIEETDVLEAVIEIDNIIDRLCDSGEIICQ